jgi:hypothetical protein
MTKEEKATLAALSADIINAARAFLPLFSVALREAAAEGNRDILEKLMGAAKHYRDGLALYIDGCEEAVSAEVIGLWDYFRENTDDLREALNRQPEGEEWKQE